MLNIIIIVLILAGLAVHRYLSAFWEQGQLPYSMGFLLFGNFFALTYLVSFIWMVGVVEGIIVSLLCYFQAVYSAGLWVFSLPWLISMNKNISIPRVNPSVYGSFPFLIIITAALTAVNFFASQYRSMWELIGENYRTTVFAFVGVLIIGNVARLAIMSKIVKE